MGSPVQHLFLQACANHGTLSIPLAMKILEPIYRKYTNTTPTDDELRELVDCINETINKFDQKIVFIKYELLNAEFIVFINTAESVINKFQSKYSEADREYFRLLIKNIALEEEHCIKPMVALNLTSLINVKSFSKEHAEEILDDWIDLGYFVMHDDKIYFGPKGMTEFAGYIKSNYPDNVQSCSLCKILIFWGIECSDCKNLFHRDCIKKYLTKLTKCPDCKQLWNTPLN